MAPSDGDAFRRASAGDALPGTARQSVPLSGTRSAGCGEEALCFTERYARPAEAHRMIAAHILSANRARLAAFPGARLGDPGWDIMLDLYVSQGTGQRVSVSDACVSAGVPISTALRHVNSLVELGYVSRLQDRSDQRRTFLQMTATLSSALDLWLSRHIACVGCCP
jgi:DNA-binding MarR family transcriptional regulator